MGAGYRTSKPQFIDHIYQPDQNLQLALAKSQIEEDALKKSLASNTDLGVKPTFQAWQGDMEKEVNNLNQEIEPLVQELLEEGTNSKTLRKLNDISRKAQDSYTNGPIGKMSSEYENWNKNYSELLDNTKKIKDDGERAAEMSRLSKYRGYVGEQAKQKSFDDFGYSGYNNFTNPDSFLEENLDADNLKSSQTYLKRESAPVIDGKVLTESERKRMNVFYDPSSNSYYMPGENGEMQDITMHSDSIEWKEHFPFSYDAMSIKEEGYDTNAIQNLSASMLYNNQAVINMLRQDFNDFGERQYLNKNGEVVIAQDADEYIAAKINQKAANYAKRFSGTTREEKLVNRKDTAGKYAWEKSLAHSYWKQENIDPLITTQLNGESALYNTPEGVENYMNYKEELNSYIDGNIMKAMVGEGSDKISKEDWDNLDPNAKQKYRNEAVSIIQAQGEDNKHWKAINSIEQKFVDLVEYGTQELLDKLPEGMQNKQSVIDNISKSLNDTGTKIEISQSKGSWKVGSNNWIGVKGQNTKDNFDPTDTATPYSNQELIGQEYNGDGFENYVISGVGSREDAKVNPRDFASKGGMVKTNGVVLHTELELVPKDLYKLYQEGGSILDKKTGNPTRVTKEMLEEAAEKVPATKFVDDYVVDFNISY